MRLSRSLYKQIVAKAQYQLLLEFCKAYWDDTSLPSSMYLSDEEASDGGKISSLFAKRFESIYLPPLPHTSTRLNTNLLVDNFHSTPSLQSSAMSDLNDNTHAGPDDIPSVYIKNVTLPSRNYSCSFSTKAFPLGSFQHNGRMPFFFQFANPDPRMTSQITARLQS